MSLFQRLVGIDQNKIPLHPFRAALSDYSRGWLVDVDIISAFSLSDAEWDETLSLLSYAVASGDPARYVVWLFDHFAIAEYGTLPDVYRNEQTFWARAANTSWMLNG